MRSDKSSVMRNTIVDLPLIVTHYSRGRFIPFQDEWGQNPSSYPYQGAAVSTTHNTLPIVSLFIRQRQPELQSTVTPRPYLRKLVQPYCGVLPICIRVKNSLTEVTELVGAWYLLHFHNPRRSPLTPVLVVRSLPAGIDSLAQCRRVVRSGGACSFSCSWASIWVRYKEGIGHARAEARPADRDIAKSGGYAALISLFPTPVFPSARVEPSDSQYLYRWRIQDACLSHCVTRVHRTTFVLRVLRFQIASTVAEPALLNSLVLYSAQHVLTAWTSTESVYES
ncbi:hypothetical protein C8R44DRAFT_981536, partial [Mycena epipterygia]